MPVLYPEQGSCAEWHLQGQEELLLLIPERATSAVVRLLGHVQPQSVAQISAVREAGPGNGVRILEK